MGFRVEVQVGDAGTSDGVGLCQRLPVEMGVTTLRAAAVTNSATMLLVASVGAVGRDEAYEVTR